MPAAPDRLLEIYLADHLAAASAGAALARRSARNNSGSEIGDFLMRLAAEIEEDRRTLRLVVRQLGFEAPRVKELVARAAEKVARLKLNGQLRGYSPLSRVIELETLTVGITGKLALWQALQRLPRVEQRLQGIHLGQLAERALRQRTEVEEQRLWADDQAFGGVRQP